jgi:hypothetical protein
MITSYVYRHQSTIMVTAASVLILAYSLLVLAAPCLEHSHPLQRALQLYHSLGNGKAIGHEGEYLLHAGTFNVLVCLFMLCATYWQSVKYWKWTNFLGLLSSLMLVASNLVISLSILSLTRALEKLDLPKQFLILRGMEWSWRGGQEELASAMRLAMLFGMTVCIGASACAAAYWKRRLTRAIRSSIQKRNNCQMSQLRNSRASGHY